MPANEESDEEDDEDIDFDEDDFEGNCPSTLDRGKTIYICMHYCIWLLTKKLINLLSINRR